MFSNHIYTCAGGGGRGITLLDMATCGFPGIAASPKGGSVILHTLLFHIILGLIPSGGWGYFVYGGREGFFPIVFDADVFVCCIDTWFWLHSDDMEPWTLAKRLFILRDTILMLLIGFT